MTKKIRTVKLLPVWIAVSAVVIIAGIILFALMGFNNSADRPTAKTFEVTYGVSVDLNEEEKAALEKTCEDAFKANGLTFEKKTYPELDGSYLSETSNMLLQYTFAGNTDLTALNAAKTAVDGKIAADFAGKNVSASVHTLENVAFGEASWRAAVAIAVGVVVALVYVGIRFGVAAALTGLVACVHDVLFTLAFFAITRIPVYTAGAILFGAVAAVVSLVLWLIRCMKMREDFKDEAFKGLSAEEAVEKSAQNSFKAVVATAGALAAVFVVIGAVAASGVRLMVLPMIIPVAVATYTSLLLAPALHAHVKKPFDRFKVNRKPRYIGKKKGEKIQED